MVLTDVVGMKVGDFVFAKVHHKHHLVSIKKLNTWKYFQTGFSY
jgi:hypothetical protein